MSTSTCTDQSYQFAGIPLSPGVTATLIKTLFPGRLLKRRTIVAGVLHHHLSSGGIGPVMPIGATAKKALSVLQAGGHAESPSRGFWRISADRGGQEISVQPPQASSSDLETVPPPRFSAEITIGSGSQIVYVLYYPSYRRLAELAGEPSWPCKIGKSAVGLEQRVFAIDAATGMPEPPVVALSIMTDNARAMETAIHCLLELRGCKHVRSPGTEWFYTRPETVESMLAGCGVVQ